MGPAPIPTLHNIDGEEVLFHRVRFPFARGVIQALVGERLDTVHALQRETTHFWNWLGEKPNGTAKSTGRMAWGEIGSTSCRGRDRQYVEISVVAVSLNKKTNST